MADHRCGAALCAVAKGADPALERIRLDFEQRKQVRLVAA